MGQRSAVYERFVAALARPPEAVPLDEAALCIAAHADPTVDVDAYLTRIDDLAGEVRTPTLDGLVRTLYSSGRYLGNTDDYYDPRNSYLHEVLDRHVGIPITLSVLGMEVGRRIGVPLSGVGLPGHFLVRDKVDPSVFIDPFNAGRELDADGCRALHRAMAGPGAPWDPGYLEPVDRPAIVARILANLRVIYQRIREVDSLRWAVRLRCAIPGASAEDHQELIRLMAPLN
jgi:regulator of sirC expression with transglutaminase-like and TPR domain